jgi:hypothetical protein
LGWPNHSRQTRATEQQWTSQTGYERSGLKRYETSFRENAEAACPHVLVHTEGLMMHAVVHAADVQDRDGELWVVATLFGLYPFMKSLPPTAAPGAKFRQGLAKVSPQLTVEIVKRSDTAIRLPLAVRA